MSVKPPQYVAGMDSKIICNSFIRIGGQGLSKVTVVAPVILSEAKNPTPSTKTLRFAQGDRNGL